MQRHLRIRLLLVAAIAAMAGAVWLASESQRSAANASFGELEAAQSVLTAMFEQQGGVRGFVETGRPAFLQEYEEGRQSFEGALARVRRGVAGDGADLRRAIAEQERAARVWQAAADAAIGRVEVSGTGPGLTSGALHHKALFASFRIEHDRLVDRLKNERSSKQLRAGLVAVGLVLLLSLLFVALGYLFIERGARAEARRRELQVQFGEVLGVARSETECYDVLRRHLERSLPGASAVVLNRNNSADRLEARTPLPTTSQLAGRLSGASPDACLSIRTGKSHAEHAGGDRLLNCELCGGIGPNATCVPSLVGGEVVGSVLVEHPRPLRPHESEGLRASVAEAAPVIANQRNLVLAEMRAATDALTGLANARAVHETLKRMVAQSLRTLKPLAAVLFDLDHFKQVNDVYGHGKGDEVLAAMADAARSGIREADFVGRYGGEEFLILLPDTEAEGARVVAEKLRACFSAVKVGGLERRVTASFGVAVMPDDAIDAGELMRSADRALYAAKAGGRDRVETLPRDKRPAGELVPAGSLSGARAGR